VWKRGFFAWEYKGKHRDLVAAYHQLADYRDDLENPPLLVVCDMDVFEVHTSFTGTQTRVYHFTLDDLLTAAPTPNCALPPLDVLRALFTDPDKLRPEAAAARVTEQAAAEFSKLALGLRQRGIDSERAAHFLMRLLFCLFADSIGLLPENMFRKMLALDRGRPASFSRKLRQLFGAMSTSGSSFGMYDIHYFNGGLFADDEVFDLTEPDLAALRAAAELDWSTVEPAIFGTLFERSLDPSKRSQLGAHYTSKEDILLIVEPVVMAPLERRWSEVKAEASELATKALAVKGGAYNKLRAQLQDKLFAWVEELSKVRVLDPACGSGNFLYVALRRMLDLWKEAYVFAAAHGVPTFLPFQVTPAQLFGLETNVYAHELASVVVWIGYLQWLNDNGIGWPTEPILRKLDNIQHRDAILAHDADGNPVEPAWPEADFIIGNPPFLGGKRLRTELGDSYVGDLFHLYAGRVPQEADLVTYWFEKARALVEIHKAKRVGLLATQSIRAGANLKVLQRIAGSGGIFMAWSDKAWILDGAAVRVSVVGFDNGSDSQRHLDGAPASKINANLTSELNLADAVKLTENSALCFMGTTKVGAFDLTPEIAKPMLSAPLNPNGRPNSDVVRPWANGMDVTGRPRWNYIIDFGVQRSEAEAALFEMPFEYIRKRVYPERKDNNRESYRAKWWIHAEPRPDMREHLSGLPRFIVTPRVAKHRLFAWVNSEVLADSRLYVFTRPDDYFLGILHSRLHEVWSLENCSWHGDGSEGARPTYVSGTCFETFPFPWPPGHEPKDSPLVAAIAEAARDLVEKRDAWLNPPNASAEELKKRTLTNLYNARPAWLADAHRKLDEAVFAAYGWPSTLTDAEILERLLALNHQRAASHGGA
jgi:type II restriction/modification system DNA methylase subunit YeeA